MTDIIRKTIEQMNNPKDIIQTHSYYTLFGDYSAIIGKEIYYYCYSPISQFKIKGMEPEDLEQQLLLKAIKVMEKYDPTRPLKPLINVAFRRKLRDIWRDQNNKRDVYGKGEVVSLFDKD